MLRRSSVFLLLVPMWLWAQAAPKASFVIKAARLIDVRSGNVLSNQQILVEDGVIKEVGPAVRAGAAAKTFDLGNATLLPGLIDCHEHVLGDQKNLSATYPLRTTSA